MRFNASLLTAALLTASPATAGDDFEHYKLGGTPHELGVSGKRGSWAAGGVTHGDWAAMYSVKIFRKQGETCKLRSDSRHMNKYTNLLSTYGGCSNAEKLEVSYVNPETFVRGINVCMESGTKGIEGIRLYGAKLDRQTGNLTNISGSKTEKWGNCTNWRTIRYCPPGQVGVSVLGHWDGGLVGIQMSCRPIVPQ
jgi:hypothetical protein